MGTINFYRRYNEDGSCETICTRCFATLGRANDRAGTERMEAAHICSTELEAPGCGSSGTNHEARETARLHPFLADFLQTARAVDTFLLILSMVLCLYLLPTVIELEMMKHLGIWISCIFFGDLVGCSFLSLGLGWRKAGAVLYVFLTACEAGIYRDRIAPAHALTWIVDVVPTVVCLVAFFFSRSRQLQVINAEEM